MSQHQPIGGGSKQSSRGGSAPEELVAQKLSDDHSLGRKDDPRLSRDVRVESNAVSDPSSDWRTYLGGDSSRQRQGGDSTRLCDENPGCLAGRVLDWTWEEG